MKVVLDEDVPRALGRELIGHEVSTVPQLGWASIKNGELLGLAARAGFEVFLTCDRNLPYQQHVPALGLALLVLAAPDNRLQTLLPLVPEVLAALDRDPQPGTLTVVGNWRV